MDLVNIGNNICKRNGRPLLVYPTPEYVAVGVGVRDNLNQIFPPTPFFDKTGDFLLTHPRWVGGLGLVWGRISLC